MAVALIADSHLGGPGGAAGPFIEQLESLTEAGCERLVLLGDIFHVWVGSPRFETPEVQQVMPALRALGARGTKLHYIEGNRDFFLVRSPYAEIFDTISTELHFEHDGVRYLAVHGDGLNDRDRQYLFWRWLSKSRPVRWLVLGPLAGPAKRMLYKTEARLAETNFKHKMQIPEAAIRRYGERRLRADADVLLLGHFHEPHRWQVEGGEIRVFDAWFNSRRVEWLGPKRVFGT